jgi:hypothetical protein
MEPVVLVPPRDVDGDDRERDPEAEPRNVGQSAAARRLSIA